MKHPSSRQLAIGASTLALFSALTWWLLHFRLRYAGSYLPSDLGDPVLNLYFLEWGARCLARGVRGYLEFWNANFFFPAHWTMTFSDHMLGPALQAGVLHRLGVGEVGGYNALFLGSFLLSGVTTTWVLRRAGTGRAAAILGGIMFAFSPYRFDQRAHLQVLLMQWIPLVLWLWHRLLEKPTVRRAIPFVAVYVLHVTGGMYLAYFVHFALLVLLLQHHDRVRELVSPRALRVLVPALLTCAAVAGAIFVPYLLARRDYDLSRSTGEIGYYGAALTSYLATGRDNWLWGRLLARLGRPENQLFAGLVATVLGLVGVLALWLRPRAAAHRTDGEAGRRPEAGGPAPVASTRERAVLAFLVALTCAGFLLGDLTTWTVARDVEPALLPGWLVDYRQASIVVFGAGSSWLLLWRRWRGRWPIPPPSWSRWERGLFLVGVVFFLLTFPAIFAPLAHVVPGLDGLRVPTRAYPFVSFALVYFAARGLDRALEAAGGRGRPAIVAAVAVLLVLELRGGMDWYEWPNRAEIPSMFQRTAEVPEIGATLHLPIARGADEAHYMYYSILDWRPIVNGYSGFEPATYVEVKRRVEDELYDAATLDYLSELGVTHIAVHPFLFKTPRERRRLARWERRFTAARRARLELVLVDGRDRLWRILPPGSGEPALP